MQTHHRGTDTTDKILCLVSPTHTGGTADFTKRATASWMRRFKDWVVRHIVQDVPEDLAACEFCRETHCTEDMRNTCERRQFDNTLSQSRH